MDLILLLKAVILGIVEGFTEFLPISSTGHLILAENLLDFTGQKAESFAIIIQAGAILAVVWEYRVKIFGVVAGLGHDPQAARQRRDAAGLGPYARRVGVDGARRRRPGGGHLDFVHADGPCPGILPARALSRTKCSTVARSLARTV